MCERNQPNRLTTTIFQHKTVISILTNRLWILKSIFFAHVYKVETVNRRIFNIIHYSSCHSYNKCCIRINFSQHNLILLSKAELTNLRKHVFSLKAPIHPKNETNTINDPAVHIRMDGSRKKSKASFTILFFCAKI